MYKVINHQHKTEVIAEIGMNPFAGQYQKCREQTWGHREGQREEEAGVTERAALTYAATMVK